MPNDKKVDTSDKFKQLATMHCSNFGAIIYELHAAKMTLHYTVNFAFSNAT